MIIILEGPDGSGKTTLAQVLAKNLAGEVVHTGPPRKDEPAVLQYLAQAKKLIQTPCTFILDRFHLGERVYGPILRGVDTLGEKGQRSLELMLNASGRVMLVRCMPPFDVCQRNWADRRMTELFTSYEKFTQTYTAYTDLPSILPQTTYDYTIHSVGDVVAEIRRLLHA